MERARGFLAGMRVRKKLIFLHTVFSLTLAIILTLATSTPLRSVVRELERDKALAVLDLLTAEAQRAGPGALGDRAAVAALAQRLSATTAPTAQVRLVGEAWAVGGSADAARARAQGGLVGQVIQRQLGPGVVAEAWAHMPEVRASVGRLLVFMGLALLGVYGLIALALEALVLPRHVYAPIREMLRADEAARSGDHAAETIPERMIPGDELGAIMRSRNRTLRQLRQHEEDLARALGLLETAANDLRKKNHVIETAQRNLADADRLASLGVMSAGLAHEMNTPLAVAKGLSERLAARGSLPAEEAALLHRVIGRLEKLGESLLDFARVRPPSAAPTELRPLVEEAWTLVRLDRQAQRVRMENRVPEGLEAMCDGGRMLQVLVNVLRNAVDATA
ncbi:MAG: hypothetical protein C0468_03855, partial [Planctomyces sp.]|nr:hypothetical protein [Planctomyces sp.]